MLAATLIALVAVVARNLGYQTPVWDGVWEKAYNATELLAAAVCGVRALRCPPSERAAWIALTVGVLGYALGDAYYTFALEDLDSQPFPSWADAGYLSIYPAAYAGLVLLLRARAGRVSATMWLDGVVTALAAAAFGAALVFGVVASTDGSLATVATNLAYPLGDLVLVALVVAIATIAGRRPGRTWALLGLGFAIFGIADTLYLYQAAVGSYEEYGLLDTAWPAALVLIALAAWQPPRPLDRHRLHSVTMLLLPIASTVGAAGLLVYDHYAEINDLALWLACAVLALVSLRFLVTFRANLRMLRASEIEATTDPLTGLGNRRALVEALEHAAGSAQPDAPHVLALFDLDGFKAYNDAFGHPAGDALLQRLGIRVAEALAGVGTAYRMGGDEFCMLAAVEDEPADALVARAARALSEQGERFRIGCSHGAIVLDGRSAPDASEALRIADQRMYANKRGGRLSHEEAVHRVLLSVVGEHDGALRHHVDDVTELCDQVGRRLGLEAGDMAHLRRAAALHDIGKVAIPDAILHAPRALTPEEWTYMRQHTIIGARIIATAPELLPVAEIVRASHERWDGNGYPDRRAGEDIPLCARIVAVCDSFDAMTTTRPYRDGMSVEDAIAEVERCSGTQFDPRVVEVFLEVLAESEHAAAASAA